ncbi:hypothetical protein AYP92_08110 [Lactobacillus crispatus]|uniref:hypothetical protein n=1 Tax=Lactobacillus TaxID=1578 RepID=UPI000B5DA4A9|nr:MULTISPECIES: hypothetical protein [Lactobacillus]OXC23213.1 hypothetical protein AYP83_01300 [Lactobacillus crispatus]OXC42714.1 hypothetical protein AYP92_08110 [Lactobacillus crispatus]PEH12451.1 hypothetical protein CP352_03150 [Lactobacillus sp. UMNPBX1]
MADETQNAPVAGAETNATQEQPTKVAPFIYYYSDPDEAETLLHHLPIPSFIDLSQQIAAGKLWHIYNISAPSKDMEDPIVDVRTNSWVENSKNAQTKVLAETTQAIDALKAKGEELDQANDKVDAAIKAMQQSQQMQTQQSLALTQGLQKVVEGQQQTAKVMASMQQILVGMKADQAKADGIPATNQPTENDKKQENGGN